MKTLDIKVEQINRIAGRRESCLYDILKTIASFYKSSLNNIYINEFGFEFDYDEFEKNGLIGEAIKQKPNSSLDNLEKFYGLKLEKCYFENFDQEMDYIKECLNQNTPAIIHFDSFNLPWDPFCNKIHNNHLLLIIGMDSKNFCILDPYFNKPYEILSIETVKKSSNFFMYFIKKEEPDNKTSFTELLYNTYGNIQQHPSASYINLESFSKEFLTSFNEEKEFSHEFFDQNTIFKNMSDCILRLGLFYELMEYQFSIENDETLGEIKDDLLNLIAKWNSIVSLTAMKHFKTVDNKQISDLISDLSYGYEEIFNLINKYIHTKK